MAIEKRMQKSNILKKFQRRIYKFWDTIETYEGGFINEENDIFNKNGT